MFEYLLIFVITSYFNNVQCTDTNFRLNTTIKPTLYKLHITPYFVTGDEREFSFDGVVDIAFSTPTETDQIKLHSDGLEFDEKNVKVFDYNESQALELNKENALHFDQNYTFVYINLASKLSVDKQYHLKIYYKGKIRKELNGFYSNMYIENGVQKWLGTTQFEPTHARKVFPCFDEPSYKAKFRLTMVAPSKYKTIISNAEIDKKESYYNGSSIVIFKETPIMSTYLLAFLVSEFENSGSKTIGVYSRPGARNQSLYAMQFARLVVDELSKYFDINYFTTSNIEKIDHIALINFAAGAMENWGHITYREAALMYVPEESSPANKYRTAQIIAHETVHQWFGDLVTCHWWSDAWLNEGFANYFQDYITAEINPELMSKDKMVLDSVYRAYTYDEGDKPKAVSTEVNSPAEISGHFGITSYQKPGSIIRMMHYLMGDNAFKSGLTSYLKSRQFRVARPEHLYEGLQNGLKEEGIENIDVKSIMEPWIKQPGHPILYVDVNLKDNKVILTQERFYRNYNSSKNSNENYPIPITYTSGDELNFEPKVDFVMFNKTHTLDIPKNVNRKWFIFNLQESGFYRVKYDDATLTEIIEFMKSENRSNIHYLNRAKIVNDYFAFYFAEKIDFDVVQKILESMANEDSHSVWHAITIGISKLKNHFFGQPLEEIIGKLALNITSNIYNRLKVVANDSESYETVMLRMTILPMVCNLGHEDCIESSLRIFREFKVNGTKVHPSLRPVVYCTGLRFGTSKDFDFLYNKMMTTNVMNDALVIAQALGCTSSTDKLLSYLLSDSDPKSPIKSQDLYLPLDSILSNYTKVANVYESVKYIPTKWNNTYKGLQKLLVKIGSSLRSEKDIKDFEKWFSSLEIDEESKKEVTKSLEESRTKAFWAFTHDEPLRRVLGYNSAYLALPSLASMGAMIVLLLINVL